MAHSKQFTVHSGPTIRTKMSLVTAGIYCTISPPLSGPPLSMMEDCSIVRVQQLQLLINEGVVYPVSTSKCTFGSLCNVVPCGVKLA